MMVRCANPKCGEEYKQCTTGRYPYVKGCPACGSRAIYLVSVPEKKPVQVHDA